MNIKIKHKKVLLRGNDTISITTTGKQWQHAESLG